MSVQKSSTPSIRLRRRAIAAAAAALLAGWNVPAGAQFFSVSGSVNTNPVDLIPALNVNLPLADFTGNALNVGNGAAGSFSVLSGGLLKADGLTVANGLSLGTMVVSGAGAQASIGAISVANWGVGSLTVTAGGLVDATAYSSSCLVLPSGCFNAIGNGAGSTGSLTISGAGSEVRTLRSTMIGQVAVYTVAHDGFDFGTPGGTTNAIVNVQGGGTFRTEQATVGFGPNTGAALGTEKAFGTVIVDGAGSRWVVGHNSIDNTAAGLTLGSRVGGQGNVTVRNGGQLLVDGSSGVGPNDFINIGVVDGKGSLTVTGAGSSLQMVGVNTVLQVGRSGSAATGSFSVLAGASASMLFLNVGRDGATGTVLIDGTGSVLNQFGVAVGNSGNTAGAPAFASIGRDGGSGSVVVSNGARWTIGDGGGNTSAVSSPGLLLGRGIGSTGSLTISGSGSVVEIVSTSLGLPPGTPDNFNPFVAVGYDNPTTSSGSLTVSAGGKLILTGNAVSTPSAGRGTSVNIGGRNGFSGTGTATVTGAGSEILLQGPDALVNVGRSAGSSGVLNVLDQGRVASINLVAGDGAVGTVVVDNARIDLSGSRTDSTNVGAGLTIGRNTGGIGTLTLDHGATLTINPTVLTGGMSIGGDQFFAGGTGSVSLAGGSSITYTDLVAGNRLNIGRNGNGTMTLAGASLVDTGPRAETRIGNDAGGVGNLNVSGGSQFRTGIIGVGGDDHSVPGGTGTASFSGAGTELNAYGATGFIGVGLGGNGSLSVTNQATLKGTLLAAGAGTAGTATITLNNATVNLSGQSNDPNIVVAGAGLYVGFLSGVGTATIGGGTNITITNNGSLGAGLALGGFPQAGVGPGTGTLNVSGGSHITIVAPPGQATVRIGHYGIGTASFSGGSTLDAPGGQLIIAGEPGSVGTLVLSSGSVVDVDYVGVGSKPGGVDGGIGTLIVNDSTVNAPTIEIGTFGFVGGNEARLNGLVVNRGILSPGNSPGRVIINGGIINAPSATLVLEVEDTGGGDFAVDRVALVEGSTFDFTNVNISFQFLGATDPNAFNDSGKFDLDTFLLSQTSTGDESGLSTVFAPGVTWNEVVANASFTATSPTYSVTEFTFDPGAGGFTIVAVPVPEPQSALLWLAGLAALGFWGRRRRGADSAIL